MSSLSDYAEAALLNHAFRNGAYSSVATVYAALFTVAPTDSGGGTEVSGAGYARQPISFGSFSGGQIDNSAAVSFTASGGAFGAVVAFGIFDAESGGNLLAWDDFSAIPVADGDSVEFGANDIVLDISSPASDFLKESWLELMFRNQPWVAPAVVYIGAYTQAPTDAGGGTEVSGNGYVRQPIAFDAPVDGFIASSDIEEFAAAGGSWGDVVHIGIFDASSAGNLLMHAPISSATIEDGDTLRFAAGDVTVSLG